MDRRPGEDEPREPGRMDERPSPESARDALARARRHGRLAAAEAARAVRALLDAASLAATGAPSEATRGLALAASALDDLATALADGAGEPILGAIVDALDAEIARWEERAERDADARAVLRAWIGLRELLWELGVRRPPSARAARRTTARPSPRAATPRRRGPLQRVPLEG